jgi:hypothetical protein
LGKFRRDLLLRLRILQGWRLRHSRGSNRFAIQQLAAHRQAGPARTNRTTGGRRRRRGIELRWRHHTDSGTHERTDEHPHRRTDEHSH